MSDGYILFIGNGSGDFKRMFFPFEDINGKELAKLKAMRLAYDSDDFYLMCRQSVDDVLETILVVHRHDGESVSQLRKCAACGNGPCVVEV